MVRLIQRLLGFLEDVDSRLLVLAAVLLCGIVFALIKATGAINGSVTQPAYRNTPAQAFIPPASVTLVSPQYLTQARLPDVDYVAVVGSARTLVDAVAKLNVSAAALEHQGMNAGDAGVTVDELHAEDAALAGRSFNIEADLVMTPGSNYASAVVAASVQYSSAAATPPVNATIDFSYALTGVHKWSLQSVTLQLQGSN
jgi:hypothetical protein